MTSSFLPPTLFPMSNLLPPLGQQVPPPGLQMQHQELAQLLPPLTAFFPSVFPTVTPVQQEPPPVQQNRPPILEFYGNSIFNNDSIFKKPQTPVQQSQPSVLHHYGNSHSNDDSKFKKPQNPVQQSQPPVLQFFGNSHFNDDSKFKKPQNPVQQSQPPVLQFNGDSKVNDDSNFKKPQIPVQQNQPLILQFYLNSHFNDNLKFRKPQTPFQQNQPPVVHHYGNSPSNDDSKFKIPQTPVQQNQRPVLQFHGNSQVNDDLKFKTPKTPVQQSQPPVLQFDGISPSNDDSIFKKQQNPIQKSQPPVPQFFGNRNSNDDSKFKKPQNPVQQSQPPVSQFYGDRNSNDDSKFKKPRTPPPKQRCQPKPQNPPHSRLPPTQELPKKGSKRTLASPQTTPMLPPFFLHYYPMSQAKKFLEKYAMHSTQPVSDDSPDIIILEGPTPKKPRMDVVPDNPFEITKVKQKPIDTRCEIQDQNPPQLCSISPNSPESHKLSEPKKCDYSEKDPDWEAKLVAAWDRIAAERASPPIEDDPSVPPNVARYMVTLVPNFAEWKYQLCMHFEEKYDLDDLESLLADHNSCILKRRLSGHYDEILTGAKLREVDAKFRHIANLIILNSTKRQKKRLAQEMLSNLGFRTNQMFKLRRQTGSESFKDMVSDLIDFYESQPNFNVRLPTPEEISQAIEDAFNKLEYEDLNDFKKMMFVFSMQYDWKNPEENTGHIATVSELTQLPVARVIEIMNAARVEIRAIIAEKKYYWSIDDDLPRFN